MKSTAKKKIEKEKKPRIQYGDVEFGPEEFEQGKFRVTMWLDLDLVHEIRERAKKDSMKYQPWINKKLRDTLLGKNSLEKRIEALEAAVFEKVAS